MGSCVVCRKLKEMHVDGNLRPHPCRVPGGMPNGICMGSGLPPREVSKVGILEAASRAIHAAEANERVASSTDCGVNGRQGLLSEAASLRVLAADLQGDARKWRKGVLSPSTPSPTEKPGDSSPKLSLPVVLLLIILLLFILTSISLYLDGWL